MTSWMMLLFGTLLQPMDTTTSSYAWITTELTLHNTSTREWKSTGKSQLPKIVKHFLWLVFEDNLSTNRVCFQRHLCLHFSCHKCGIQKESLPHLLRDCPNSKMVWNILQFSSHASFQSNDAMDWITTQMNLPRGGLFACACWFTQCAQDMKIFKDKKWQPWFIINQAKTTYDIAFSPPPNPKAQKQPLAVSRSSLAENSIKLDVDGQATQGRRVSAKSFVTTLVNGSQVFQVVVILQPLLMQNYMSYFMASLLLGTLATRVSSVSLTRCWPFNQLQRVLQPIIRIHPLSTVSVLSRQRSGNYHFIMFIGKPTFVQIGFRRRVHPLPNLCLLWFLVQFLYPLCCWLMLLGCFS